MRRDGLVDVDAAHSEGGVGVRRRSPHWPLLCVSRQTRVGHQPSHFSILSLMSHLFSLTRPDAPVGTFQQRD